MKRAVIVTGPLCSGKTHLYNLLSRKNPLVEKIDSKDLDSALDPFEWIERECFESEEDLLYIEGTTITIDVKNLREILEDEGYKVLVVSTNAIGEKQRQKNIESRFGEKMSAEEAALRWWTIKENRRLRRHKATEQPMLIFSEIGEDQANILLKFYGEEK